MSLLFGIALVILAGSLGLGVGLATGPYTISQTLEMFRGHRTWMSSTVLALGVMGALTWRAIQLEDAHYVELMNSYTFWVGLTSFGITLAASKVGTAAQILAGSRAARREAGEKEAQPKEAEAS